MHFLPAAYCTSNSAFMVSIRAASLIGSTIPLVPSIEMPPTIPNLGLKVFLATSSPSGA